MSKRVWGVAPLFAAVVAMSFVLVAVAGPASALSPPYTTVTHVHTNHPTGLLTGEPVSFTAAVTTAGTTSLATGSVTFTITGSDLSTVHCDGGSDTLTLTPVAPITGSTAVCAVSAGLFAVASPYTIAVAYTGDGTHLASNGTLSQVVVAGPTKTTVTSSSNPSVTGQPVTLTATVAPTGGLAAGNPTGTVMFTMTAAGGAGVDCDGGDVVPVSSGMAQCTISGGLLASGNPVHVVATYSGDGNFKTSMMAFTQMVKKDATTIVVNPSVNPVVTGQAVSFTAVLTPDPTGGGTFTGTVTFTITPSTGPLLHCDGGNTVAVSGNQATCSFAAGLASSGINDTVSATLNDPNFAQVAAGSVTEVVNEAATNLAFSISPPAVKAGVTFTITATITPVAPGVGTPTGVVDFSICQEDTTGLCVGGATVMPASANGVAKWTVNGGQMPGATEITVTYLGDSNFSLSSNGRTIPIGLVSTQLNLSSSKNPSASGAQVRINAAVLSLGASSSLIGPPTGDVQFTITGQGGDTVTCQGGVTDIGLGGGTLTQALAICVIPAGSLSSADAPYSIHATYSGDGTFYLPSNAAMSQNVV